jgi:Uma2 family endonuclease
MNAMSTQPRPLVTVEQYLRIERAAQFRSEYIEGEVIAMPGGSRNHALIAAEVLIRLGPQLRGTEFAVAGSDTRLFCRQAAVLTYPDCVVFSDNATFLDDDEDTLTDATVIVEVLSPSTRNFDRGEKFRCYRGLPSFQEYLLLEQDAIRAEHYVRQPDGTWLLREVSGASAEIVFDSIGCRLILGELYSRAKIEPQRL